MSRSRLTIFARTGLTSSRMSSYPSEEELLFYGRNVIFAVLDVAEADSHTNHSQEVALFNLLQKVVLNEEWTVDGKQMLKMANALEAMI